MAVSVNQVQIQPKKDPLDTIIKGLQIAGGVYGIKEASAKIDALDAERKKNELASTGTLTAEQLAELGTPNKGYKFAKEGDEGAIAFKVAGQDVPTYLIPGQKEVAIKIPGHMPYLDPKTNKSYEGVIGSDGKVIQDPLHDSLSANQPATQKDIIPAQEDSLRTYRDNNDTTKKTNQLAVFYSQMGAATKNPSPAGDIKLVFNFMKMLDPTSTVREGEQAQAQNAASVPDRYKNVYNALLTGERLTAEQRQDFLGQAADNWELQRINQNKLDEYVAGLAVERGLNPKHVIFNVHDLNTSVARKDKGAQLDPALSDVPHDDYIAEMNKRIKAGTIKFDVKTPDQQAAGMQEFNKRGSSVGQK